MWFKQKSSASHGLTTEIVEETMKIMNYEVKMKNEKIGTKIECAHFCNESVIWCSSVFVPDKMFAQGLII